jgi:hypothetical protein
LKKTIKIFTKEEEGFLTSNQTGNSDPKEVFIPKEIPITLSIEDHPSTSTTLIKEDLIRGGNLNNVNIDY